MGWIEENMKSTHIRQIVSQAISLGMVISSALIIWKGLICITGSESPVVVVLSGSMEPGFKRGRDVPIVHRVIEVHEQRDNKEADILTKGDANLYDDRMLYTSSNRWLQQKYIMGRAVGFLPYVGWLTIIMTDKPIIKYILLGALGLLVITSKE
ncbi:hypothetical protein ES319_D06G064600v1 [Gossypium barbadense]|uniref:Signal peptidase I n=2 Tax=Gossypium TaxID=3633 RepID=A0A5J5QY91_GOSBA|nr:hypothetical protein ES319_D06G064600v1 [Gossypium barbadense]KAB2024112.1 hypothetical protein ES319_D06G064600v1 [Gossypium barbadense]TYG63957.1 hypothetical protein ES288_D06G070200v1 [Gossypium darwinii]TYG63959.1 hypothetical protein ES288_D06G070200v1 [Gossypium darwinii]TYG63961.1 hypothetical protein ES288_D06G070200v1 [Gossypium darwinii]